jgi:2',3'-cyclic-nucleotide 2'-phosphodiesterase/3'-nucleotidase
LLAVPPATRLSRALTGSAPAPDSLDLIIASTTDVHGHLRGWDYFASKADPARGLSRAATVVDSLRATDPGGVVLVDAGDFLQGTPLTFVAAREDSLAPNPVIAAMNAMRCDAAAVGNHEFNYGVPYLRRAESEARFPLLAANAYTPAGARAFAAWTMLGRRGVKIAVVGATTPGSMLWDRDHLAGRVVLHDIVPDVRAAVDSARAAGADVVIVVLHSGLDEPSSYDTVSTHVPSENVAARVAREVPGIDLLVFGHSHKELASLVIGHTLLVQPKNWATSVSVAHLALVREDGRWRVVAKHASLVPTAGHAENRAVLDATARGHADALRYAATVIGRTGVPWRADSARVADTPLIDFVLDVERRASGAQLASTAVFSTDASLAAGPVTVAEIAALYPYDNTLRAVKITGAELRSYLEQSARYFRRNADGTVDVDPAVPGFDYDVVAGVDYTIDLALPTGHRITKLEYQGRPVVPTDSFTLALNNYRQTGGGGYAMLRTAPVVYDRQLEIRQLLIDEVRRRAVLVPRDYVHYNWRIVPPSAIGRLLAHQQP